MKTNTPPTKVIFVRIGWMHFYNGSTRKDEKPIGGGSHNIDEIGHELFNFRDTKGICYGYFQPPRQSNTVNLFRIDVTARGSDKIPGVLVIYVAPRAGFGQVIVGWYRDATIYRYCVSDSPGKPLTYGHYCKSNARECVLLPEYKREYEIPKGKLGMGQANVCYSLKADGTPKDVDWIETAISYIHTYDDANLLIEPTADAAEVSADAVDQALAGSDGQGFAKNAEERRAIELHAMKYAKKYFEELGYLVHDISKSKPYDLECTRKGNTIHVEVKGTTNLGKLIVLTENEICHAKNNACTLFVLHSIRLLNGKACGGVSVILDPWVLNEERLRAISYTYRL